MHTNTPLRRLAAACIAAALVMGCLCACTSSSVKPKSADSGSDILSSNVNDKAFHEQTPQQVANGLPYLIEQCNPAWAERTFGELTFAWSGCGICSLCNAAYYTSGVVLDPMEVATWAYNACLYNVGTEGCFNNIFQEAGKHYGNEGGFSATGVKTGSILSDELVGHLRSGGVAVINAPSHFMVATKYDDTTQKFFVIDSMPGDFGRYDNRRKGITHSGGDWLSAETLSTGLTEVTGYALFFKN